MDSALVLILARLGVSCVEQVNKQYMWSVRKTVLDMCAQQSPPSSEGTCCT
jgi:hypothetical protein